MATKAQKVRLSIFLILSTSILLIFFLVLVGSRILKRMDPYNIVYEGISVTGLEPGAAVKYHGVQVGRVTDLSLRDAASIRVDTIESNAMFLIFIIILIRVFSSIKVFCSFIFKFLILLQVLRPLRSLR